MSLLEFANWLQATPLSITIQTHAWIVPALQSVHIIMIGVVFVSILMVARRVLGRTRADEPLPRVWARFAPFLWTGIAVMAATGILLTISEPVRELMTLSFRLKMILLAIAVASAALFGRKVRGAALADAGSGGAARVSGAMRLAAVATVILWLAIIFLGRAIAYDNLIWGEWSPAILQGGGAR
jgi:hypothetical protein